MPANRTNTGVPGSGNPSATPPATANRAPTIGGKPNDLILMDQVFVFQPAAADPDGDVLTFSILEKPGWAKFDSADGTLRGKPRAADVRRYDNIQISVSDGRETAVINFSFEVVAVGMLSITLSWSPATEREDGTPLAKIKGHNIYWGTIVEELPNVIRLKNPGITTYVIDGLVPGTYYIAMSTIDGEGIESALSDPVEVTLQ